MKLCLSIYQTEKITSYFFSFPSRQVRLNQTLKWAMHPFCINQRTIKLFQKLYHSSCMRIITIKMKCNNVREFYVFPIHLTMKTWVV